MLGNISMQKPEDNNVPELLTANEAADVLKVHINTLRKWDKNGTLPAIRIGERGIRRYSKDDIKQFLKQSKQVNK